MCRYFIEGYSPIYCLSPSRSSVFQTTTFCRGHIRCRLATVIGLLLWPLRHLSGRKQSASLPIRRWASTSLHAVFLSVWILTMTDVAPQTLIPTSHSYWALAHARRSFAEEAKQLASLFYANIEHTHTRFFLQDYPSGLTCTIPVVRHPDKRCPSITRSI